MCQIFSLKGMGEREWWGFLLAEEKKGIVCPYLSVFSGYSTLAAESRGD